MNSENQFRFLSLSSPFFCRKVENECCIDDEMISAVKVKGVKHHTCHINLHVFGTIVFHHLYLLVFETNKPNTVCYWFEIHSRKKIEHINIIVSSREQRKCFVHYITFSHLTFKFSLSLHHHCTISSAVTPCGIRACKLFLVFYSSVLHLPDSYYCTSYRIHLFSPLE